MQATYNQDADTAANLGCTCTSCNVKAALNAAAGLLRTLWGQLVPGPLYSDQIAPAYPQPHKMRDGIPWTGLLPTIRIDAPANPDLILNPILATTLFLRPMRRVDYAPRRNLITIYPRGDEWKGRSG